MKVTIAPDFQSLLPPLSAEEYEHLKANNLSDPNHERVPPIVIWQCGKEWILVDGHHTYKARESMRVNGKPVKIRYHKMEFNDREEAKSYARRAQLGRRNLSPSQVAMILAAEPKRPKGPNLASWEKQGENADFPPNREELAKDHGISHHTMKHGDKVMAHAAEAVKKAVVDKVVTVSDAASIADLPKGEQATALKTVKRGEAKTLKVAAAPKKKKPAKGKEKPSPAAIFTAMQQKHFSGQSGLPQQLEAMAKINGGRGEQYKIAKDGLNNFLKATKAMRGGAR